MKLHKLCCLSAALVMAASVGAGAIPVWAAEPSASGDFFSDTAVAGNYGTLTSPSYQGENGVWLLGGTADENVMLLREGNVWSSGTDDGLATVEGSLYTPGEEGVIWKWQAPSGGTVHFKGVVYNAVTVSEAGDLTSFGVEARTAGTGDTRDGVSLSVLHVSGEAKNSLYTADETSDFTLFTDKTLSVRKGDSVLIRVDGKEDDACDGVRLYMGVDFDEKIAAYDLTKQENLKAGVLEDITGNGHNLTTNYPDFQADPVKGMQFAPTTTKGYDQEPGTSTEQKFYDPDFGTHDFTDDLTDFTIRVAYTLGDDGGEYFLNSWAYIFSTTSHSGREGHGLALCINSMNSSDSKGKHKYALNLRFDVAGEQGFFGGTNCWTNGLVEGGSYVTVINVSTTKHKIETFTTGTYNDGWNGTNKCAGGTTATTEDTWTMDNSNLGTAGEGLLLGGLDSSGANSFNGWISSFEITPMHTTFDASSQVAGGFTSELNYAAANSVVAIAEKAELKDNDAATLSSFATKSVTLNLAPEGTATGSVTWNDVVFDGTEYYVLGSVQAAGYDVNGLTAKASVDAKAVKLSVDGKYVGFVAAKADEEFDLDRLFDFVPLGSHATWYTDKAMTAEYAGGAANTLYGKVEESEWAINYELDGGTNSPDNPATYRYSDGTVTLKAPTKEGYTFEGWYLEDTFQTKISALETSEMREITIYAKWTENAEGGSQGGSQGGTEGGGSQGGSQSGTEGGNGGGCGSVITGGVVVTLVTACGAALFVSRKRH